MRTADREVQEHVLTALDREPGIDPAKIGVTVKNGVVTLTGSVTTFHEKCLVDRAARHVHHVRAVNDRIDISE